MNQDQNKKPGQGQNQDQHQNQGQGQPGMKERGNPPTTERIQPEPSRGERYRHEGENKPTGSEQPKF